MKSLRLRAALGSLVWSAAGIAIAGWVIWSLFSASAARQFDARLEAHLTELASAIAVTDQSRDALDSRMSDPRFHRPFSGLYWQAEGPDSTIQSRSLWDTGLVLPVDKVTDGAVHRHEVAGPGDTGLRALERTIRTPRDGTWRIVVAADRRELDDERVRFLRALVLSLGALGIALGAAAAGQAALILRPLGRLRTALQAYRAGETKRVEGVFPSEIAPLADDLNALLDRNDTLVIRARRRAADLAHALKTPVAALRNEIDAMHLDTMYDGLSGDRFAIIQEALARIETQTRRQMARARIALVGPGANSDVAAAVARLTRALDRIYVDRGLSITSDIPENARFQGDAEDLEEMLGNLMDNACKWARSRLHISARTDPSTLVILIEDDGPGIPGAARDTVVRAGIRLDETREGSGLGLAIVQDIVDAYEGTLSLDPSPMGGLCATLEFGERDTGAIDHVEPHPST